MTRVVAFGFRGFPGVEGGIETHAENLYPLLKADIDDVRACVRCNVINSDSGQLFRGVRLVRLWSGPFGSLETIVHSCFALVYAVLVRGDIVHIHGIGPAVLTPFARLFGIKVVVTHHGREYDADKWGALQRWLLRIGECLGVRYANAIITVSEDLKRHVHGKFGVSATTIPNGVVIHAPGHDELLVRSLGLQPRRYVIEVARITQHKHQDQLIEAFLGNKSLGWKLLLVGDATEEDEYTRKVVSMAAGSPDIVLAGFRTGAALRSLYEHAGVFALPSSYEGMPIAVLEALSFGVPVVLSDIPAHLELGLPDEHYHAVGDTDQISTSLALMMERAADPSLRAVMRSAISKYDWPTIAQKTQVLFSKVLERS